MLQAERYRIPLFVENSADSGYAHELANCYGFTLCTEFPDTSFYLAYLHQRLELHQQGKNMPGPIYIDFSGGPLGYRRRYGGGRKQPLARAMGIRPGYSPDIVDATAGLGRDAFVLACLGCEVKLCERSPVIAALLDDGLKRGIADMQINPCVQRMALKFGDSYKTILGLSDASPVDVIYLDPMFPESHSSARVKKGMAALQAIIGEDSDSGKLLETSFTKAARRVVVKRPQGSACLGDRPPHTAIKSKNIRYDVYMTRT